MSVKLLQDELVEFYQQHKDKISDKTATLDDQYKFYKGWIATIQEQAKPVLDRLSSKEKLEFLKHHRLPKEYNDTIFGEAYVKLEELIDKMFAFDYTRFSYTECMKFYASCDKYVTDLMTWYNSKEKSA